LPEFSGRIGIIGSKIQEPGPKTPQYLRERAAECARLAASATDPKVQEIMSYLAERWRGLAAADKAARHHASMHDVAPDSSLAGGAIRDDGE